MEKLIECIAIDITSITLLCVMIVLYFKQNKIRELFIETESIWKFWSSIPERKIISTHANYGRLITIICIGILSGAVAAYIIQPIFPRLLDIIVPLNESRSKEAPYPIYYFLNYSEKHFNWIVLYFTCNSFSILIILIAFESVLAVSIEHACGLFKLISLNLRTLNAKMTEMENLQIVYFCVEQHNQAIKYCDIIESIYSPCLFFVVSVNCMFFSLSLYEIVTHLNDFAIAAKFGLFVFSSSTNLMIPNFFSQRLMDHSTELADIVYDIPWNQMQLRVKRNFVFIMMRSRIPCKITAGKMLDLSFRTATAVRIFLFRFLKIIIFRKWNIMSNTFDNHYFYVNKFFLSCIGQWPFHNEKRNFSIQCFIILHLFIFFIPTATGFFKACGNMNTLTECIPTVCSGITSLSFSIIFLFKQEKLIKLYREIKFDWECLSSDQDQLIISKHANHGRRFTIFFTGCIIGSLITYNTLMSSTPQFFNMILPVNESRTNQLPCHVYYFFNYSEKYFYWIIVHFSFNTLLETVIFIVFESVLAVSIEHACGLFKKIGLHVQKINCTDTEKDNLRALMYCVSEHNRAIEFCGSIKALYWPCFMFIVTLNSIFISVSLIQIVAHSNNFIVAVKYGAFVGNSMIHLFFNTHFAQRIMDYSTGLTDTVYNSLWYKKPSGIRKSLLLIMIRSRIPCNITAVKLLNISLRSACWHTFLGSLMGGCIGYVMPPLFPQFLDIVAPLNESRPKDLPFPLYCDDIESIYSPCFFVVISLNCIFFSLSLIEVVTHIDDFEIVLKFGVLTSASGVNLVIDSFLSQKLMDYSTRIADIVYDIEWDQIPVRVQKNLILIMIRCRNPCKITAGKMLDISYQTGVAIVKASFSCFTLLLSTTS
ncbi:uncharacterized protein LOC122505641 [Leptopilina heterotoma]|uniref:uncharacterized protein LOC122505641 n=1 Tax=Leptopilina heterotoma TaxID=63436 RepID=UPI001CA84298|nr:uncharacterized protein LOC122505641 [Leptopilina heterotoma]